MQRNGILTWKENNHEKTYTCESNQKSDLNDSSKEPLQYFQRTIGNWKHKERYNEETILNREYIFKR